MFISDSEFFIIIDIAAIIIIILGKRLIVVDFGLFTGPTLATLITPLIFPG